MIDIKITGIEELRRELRDFSERRIRAAVATALTRTAVIARNEVAAKMPQVFDNPTPYTVGSSGKAFEALMEKLRAAEAGGDNIWIEIQSAQ